MKDYYKILEIDESASQSDIKKAYRELAKKWHPDKNQNSKESEDKFKEITEAYDELGSEEKRKAYDIARNSTKQFSNTFSSADWGGMDINDIMQDLQGTGFEKMFDNIYGGGTYKAKDTIMELHITLYDAFYGIQKTIQLYDSTVKVKIEKGIDTGHVLRIKGKGNPHPFNSRIPRGDLLLRIIVNDDKTYERKGNDLYMNVSIPSIIAITGGDTTIPYINGKLKINVNKLSKNNEILRVKGKGMPLYKIPNEFGDLYVKLNVILPEKLSDEEEKLYNKIKEIYESGCD